MTVPRPDNPLIVQGDRSVLLEVHSPRYEEARDGLCRFAELEKSPEHVHTYRITPLSLWNAAAAGLTADEALHTLSEYSKYELPDHVGVELQETIDAYGRARLLPHPDSGELLLEVDDEALLARVMTDRKVGKLVRERLDPVRARIASADRGELKREMMRLNLPVEDLAGFVEGEPLDIPLRETTLEGRPFGLRDYQREAVAVFHQEGRPTGGAGVIVLPCGAGKTIVGIGVMAAVGRTCLVLATGVTSARQWIREILDKTELTEEQVGEYSGDTKELKPVTVATYQVLTWRKSKKGPFPHFEVFNRRDWGLIVHDEVHLLPAPVFRVTADLQSRRRLGLTATLVREDGHESDVFTLIGPKRYDVPWKELERQGFIAEAECQEIRIALPGDMRLAAATAEPRQRLRMASENPAKGDLVELLAKRHRDDSVLVIGQYLDQLQELSERLDAPLLTGRTPQPERDVLYDRFRSGELKLLVVSKVANFAVDLPDARIAIQVSGTFGSRQEEAQRLGRLLRPKDGRAVLYSLVTKDSVEQDHAMNRRRFLAEQGYGYVLTDGAELLESAAEEKAVS
ncbi:MAG: DNA repair helicase XPB [Acidobacteriota bacterium]